MIRPYKIMILDKSFADAQRIRHELSASGFAFETVHILDESTLLSQSDINDFDAVLFDQYLLSPNMKKAAHPVRMGGSLARVLLIDGVSCIGSALTEYAMHDYIIKSELARLPFLLINIIERIRTESKLAIMVQQKCISVEKPSEISANLLSRIILANKEAGIGIWEYQVNENKFIADEVMLEQFELSPGSFTGNYEELLDKVYVDDRESLINELTEKVLNYIDFTVEYRILLKDRSLRYIKVVGVAYDNLPGSPACMIGTNQDITADKIAEQKILLSEERFKSLVQNSNDLLAIIDSQGNYKYVSPSSFKILGYQPEHFKGKNALDFIHADDQVTTLGSLGNVLRSKMLVVPLFRFQNAAGEWRWIESTVTNMLDEVAVQGIVVNSRDVTERKKANDEIEKLSLVAKNTLSGVYILNKDARIQWVNEAFTNITGYTLEDVIGKHPVELLYKPGTGNAASIPISQHIEKNVNFEGESLQTSKSGADIWVWLQLQVLFDAMGNVTQYFGVQTDITKEKELEEKVRIERILKQKEITAAVYGAQENERSEIGRELHDNVNQLLGAVRLYINMARSNNADRDSFLNDASSFALTAIEEIRKLSKTLITPHINEVGLLESIRELAGEIMHVHPLRINVVAENFVEDGYNDKFKLNIFRICQEQLNNVLKHAGATEADIVINISPDTFFISISDNGVGLKECNGKKGVGITNIKSRSGLYNGKAHISSEEGMGTTLSINFPNSNLIHKTLQLRTLQ